MERKHAAEWRATIQHHTDLTRAHISALPAAPAGSAFELGSVLVVLGHVAGIALVYRRSTGT